MASLLYKLSFPGLGLEFDIDRVAFSVAGKPVYWYGIIIAIGFLVAAVYALRRVKRFGLDADRTLDVILGALVLGVVGARLYYVLFTWDTYKDSLGSVVKIWEGGLAIYGGILGGLVGATIMCRLRQVKLLPLFDLCAGSLLLGQSIGRWGNFMNMEAFGNNTSLPWGMTSPTIQRYLIENRQTLEALGVAVDPEMPVHPTFLYESVWCLIGFGLLHWYTSRRRFDGELILLYAGWYGLGRCFIEGLRTDSLLLGSLRVSQLLAILCVVASVAALVFVYSRIRRSGDPDYLPLYVDTEEGKAVVAGTFYPEKEEKAAKASEGDEEPDAQAGREDPVGDPDASEPDGGDAKEDGGDGVKPPSEDVEDGDGAPADSGKEEADAQKDSPRHGSGEGQNSKEEHGDGAVD